MSSPSRCFWALVGLGFAVGACSTVRTAPAPRSRDAASLAAAHRERADRLERERRLRQAHGEWTIVLTIDPNDARARARKDSLERRIDQAVAEHLRQGRDALDRGDAAGARRQFLAALALDPANRLAFETLQSEVPPVDVPPLPERAPPAVPAPTAGAQAVPREAAPAAPSPAPATTGSEAPGARAGTTFPGGPPAAPPDLLQSLSPDLPPRETVPDLAPGYLDAIEAFERGQHAVALRDVDRALAVGPGPPAVLELKKEILYEMGRQQFDRGQYAECYRTLTQLAGLAADYEDVSTLLDEARSQLVRRHYTEGIRLFRDERLAEAIAEWRVVLEYDPLHANARQNIEQAERLLRGLRERQRQ